MSVAPVPGAAKASVAPPGWPPEVSQRLLMAPFLAPLKDHDKAKLLKGCELLQVGPREELLPGFDLDTGRRLAPTPLLFVIEGEARVHGAVFGVERTLNFVRRDEVFYNRTYTEDERARLQVTSMSPMVALAIPAAVLDGLLQNSDQFKAGFLEQLKVSRERKQRHFQDVHNARVTSFVVEERLLPTNRVKILRHDLCVECNACYDACAERHGVSRLWPSDVHVGVLSIPANCHNCHYPTCEAACKFDVLRYDEDENELRVSHNCVGCQQCSRSCSYGAITMVPFDLIDQAYMSTRNPDARGGRMYAVKCDNCTGYNELACVSACPTGALFQLDGAQLVDMLEHLDPAGIDNKVLRKLNPEPWPWFKWLMIGLFVVVTFLSSYEVAGWYYWPGSTVTELLHGMDLISTEVPRDTEYPYRAGDDLSMVFGYSSTALMLLAQLYRVRKIVPWLGGDMRLWLHAHIWLSLTAAVLAFWHLGWGFINLSAVAWWSFFTIIVTGFIGGYLHTWLPRSAAGSELKLSELETRLAQLTHKIEGFFSSAQEARAALGTGAHRIRNATSMTRLQDLKIFASPAAATNEDGADGKYLTGVFNLLQADLHSLKDRDEKQRAAARRAGVSGELKAELEQLLRERKKLEKAVSSYETIRNYSRKWHVVHKVFSYLFFISLTLHIGFKLLW